MPLTRAQSRQALRLLCQAMKSLYANLDQCAATAIKQHTDEGRAPSCKQSCDACCHIPVVITKIEALVIADRIHSWKDWKEWPEKLANAAQPYCAPEYNRTWYADQRPPCPFLVDKQCRIYDIRPAPCRFYYVCTPAERCGDRIHRDVAMLDFTELEMRVVAFSNEALKEFSASCLPLAVLEAMIQAGHTCDRQHVVMPSTEGLPPPMKWMVDCLNRGGDIDVNQDSAVRRSWQKLKAQGVPGTEGPL